MLHITSKALASCIVSMTLQYSWCLDQATSFLAAGVSPLAKLIPPITVALVCIGGMTGFAAWKGWTTDAWTSASANVIAIGVFLHYINKGFIGNPPWDLVLIGMFGRLECQNTANVSIF